VKDEVGGSKVIRQKSKCRRFYPVKNKELVTLIGSICLVLVLAALPFLTACAAPAENVYTLKVLRPWPYDCKDMLGYRAFLDRANAAGQGRLVLKDVGGSEVYPSFEQFEPLRTGAVDLLFTCTSYITSGFPEAEASTFTFGATPSELRESGFTAKIDEIGRQEYGVAFLGFPWFASFNIFLKNPIETLDDLKGVKIRSIPEYDPILKGLGVATVTVPFDEVYTALERGTIDGYCFPYHDITTYGFEEITRYRVDPPFWRFTNVGVFVNLQSWDALPKDLQKLLTDSMIQVEKEAPDMYDTQAAEEWQEQKAAGIQSIRVSDEEWQRTQEIEWEEAQKLVPRYSAKYGQELLQLLSQFFPPKEIYPVLK